MATVFYTLTALLALISWAVLTLANGAIHEIQGIILLLIAAVTFSAAAIIGKLNKLIKLKSEPQPKASDPSC